jgi:hypothetical protein
MTDLYINPNPFASDKVEDVADSGKLNVEASRNVVGSVTLDSEKSKTLGSEDPKSDDLLGKTVEDVVTATVDENTAEKPKNVDGETAAIDDSVLVSQKPIGDGADVVKDVGTSNVPATKDVVPDVDTSLAQPADK